ncbi:hypothetical protein B0H11DRAFT_1908409 [Mycena galericulata]|nr:hypothetical protein B0H11DRAFT_1908409 [Mycena galericulata]
MWILSEGSVAHSTPRLHPPQLSSLRSRETYQTVGSNSGALCDTVASKAYVYISSSRRASGEAKLLPHQVSTRQYLLSPRCPVHVHPGPGDVNKHPVVGRNLRTRLPQDLSHISFHADRNPDRRVISEGLHRERRKLRPRRSNNALRPASQRKFLQARKNAEYAGSSRSGTAVPVLREICWRVATNGRGDEVEERAERGRMGATSGDARHMMLLPGSI